MKTSRHFLMWAIVATCVLGFQLARAQDPVKVAPQAFTVKLDNSHARVLAYHSKPGDKEAMHSHPAVLLYIVTGGKIKSTTADGKSTVNEYKAGDVVWREAITHSGENVGTTEVSSILVEFKEAAAKK